MIKTQKLFCLLIITALTTSGCASNYDKKEYSLGKVMEVTKVEKKDLTPKAGTAIGAATGFSVGAVIGGAMGAVSGVGISVATFGMAAPMLPGLVAAGALAGGAVSAAVGGAAGYVVDYRNAGDGLYEYLVQQLSNDKEITIRQVESKPKSKGEIVKIIWDKDHQMILSFKEETITPQK